MSKQISSLKVALLATIAPFNNGLKLGEKGIASFVGKIGELGGKLIELTGIAGIVGGAIGGVFELGKGFSLAAQFETANVQLTALTGSANNAHILMGQLRDFAKSSPFEFPELLEASKKLMAVGVNADQITPLLKQVGEVAAGTGSDIGSVADIFVKVAAEGKVTSKELKEFGKEGIPVVQTLAAQFHTTAAGVAELADNGTIGFAQLQKAFQSMTGPGGKFNGILAAQSQTIGGVMHTMVDTVEEAGANVAESLLRAFNVSSWLPKVTAAFDGIGETISRGISVAAPYVIGFGASVVRVFEGLYASAQPAIMRVWGIVQGVWGGMSALVSTYGGLVVNAAVGMFNQVLDFARPIWEAVYGTIASNWTRIYSTTVAIAVGIFDLVSTVWTTLVDVAYQIWGGLTGLWAWGWKALGGSTADGANDTQTMFGSIVKIFEWLGDAASATFGFIGYSIQNFGTLVQLVGTGVAFDFVRLGNQIVWVFTGVIWPGIQWIGSQLWDWVRWTGTVFANLGSNIARVMSAIWTTIKGGTVDWSNVWQPLTDGFKSTAESWPGIADREAGPLEKALQGQYEDLSTKFGEGLGNHLAKNAEKAAAIVKTTTDGIDKATKPKINAKDIKIPEIPKPDPLNFDVTVNPQNMTVGITPEIRKAKAMLSGSAESLAARFNTPIVAAGAGGPIIPPVQPNGAGPMTANASTQPPSPRVAGTSGAAAAASSAADKAQSDQLMIANQWLYRIEQNTRNGSTGDTVVSI